jgi:RNA polymerase sigma-70 factor (ECF subfamily)
MSEEEARLVQQAKEGAPQAFAQIYERYQPNIHRYIHYRVQDYYSAQDLVSEVFVRLVERIDSFTYRGSPILAWLYTIARNLIADYHRAAARSPQIGIEDLTITTIADPVSTTDPILTKEILATALTHLTEEQCQVVLLKFIEGFDNESVAVMMDKSVGAIKSLQHRALVVLRRVFERNDI